VLEHVDDPASLLAALRGRVDRGAPAFVSTVANMEAEDHVYLFHDAQHIRSRSSTPASRSMSTSPSR
jgi:2-polyprenyl-3-methyl-5-hydroxy-6-metoxy-1,4-benzoquinol methylase